MPAVASMNNKIISQRDIQQLKKDNRQNKNDITFQVCGESNSWVRPTAAEQKRHLESLNGRYSPEIIEELGGDYWKYNIFAFTEYPGGSGTYDIVQLAGFWQPHDAKYPAKCENYVTELNAGKIARAWTQYHKVVSIKWVNNRYVMQVKPTKKGRQIIQFPRQESLNSLPLTVVNERGQSVSVLFNK